MPRASKKSSTNGLSARDREFQGLPGLTQWNTDTRVDKDITLGGSCQPSKRPPRVFVIDSNSLPNHEEMTLP